jgi:hypothetical protein
MLPVHSLSPQFSEKAHPFSIQGYIELDAIRVAARAQAGSGNAC